MKYKAIVCVTLAILLSFLLPTGCRQATTSEAIGKPEIVSTFPVDAAVNLPVDTNIQFLFSMSMDKSATESAFSVSPEVDYSISWQNSDQLMLVSVTGGWQHDTSYELTINGSAHSATGVEMAENYTLAFKTEGVSVSPVITATNPENGATLVPVSASVSISFSAAMDRQSVEAALTISPDTEYQVTWGNNGLTMTITATDGWVANQQYDIVVTTDAVSQNGLPLGVDYVFSFQTQPLVDGPTVISTDPENDSVIYSGTNTVEIRFSEPMDTEATEAALSAQSGSSGAISGLLVSWEDNNQLLIITFPKVFIDGESYSVVLTKQARSAAGVYMQEIFLLLFKTITPC
jgi:methionine-rich copper-binding protein CopC